MVAGFSVENTDTVLPEVAAKACSDTLLLKWLHLIVNNNSIKCIRVLTLINGATQSLYSMRQ